MTKFLSTLVSIACLAFVSTQALAQGGVGINGSTAAADSSAMIDVSSTSKGMLAPRMTSTQRAAISRPATGLLVYQTDGTAGFYYNGGGKNSPNWIQLSTSQVTQIQDADNDTKIQVDEYNDEDIIHFDMAGTEFFQMEGGRLEVLNTGFSVFMGNRAGLNDDLTANNNVFVGYEAGMSNTTGSSNIGIGSFALDANTSGFQNTAVGRAAFRKSSTGSFNVGLGNNAGLNNTYGASNTAIGTESLQGNSTGNYNTSIGYFASIFTTGSDNTVVGSEANRFNTAGTQNTIIGKEAGRGTVNHSKSGNVFIGFKAGYNDTTDNKLYIENSSSATPLIYGDFANDLVKIHGTLNVNDAFTFPTTDGTSNQVLKTNGSGVLSWTTKTGNVDQDLSLSGNTLSLSGSSATANLSSLVVNSLSDDDADTKIQVEEGTDEDKVRFDIGGTEKWVMTGSRLESVNTGSSVFIGYQAGLNDDLSNEQVFIGHNTGVLNTSGGLNVAIGTRAFFYNTTGDANTTMGHQTGHRNTTGRNNTALGSNANFSNTTGGFNTAIGSNANYYNTTGSNNTAIGHNAGGGPRLHSKSGNVSIGYNAGSADTTDNKLHIDNSASTTPLIWGDFANDLVNVNGKLGIGTSSPSCPLEISGSASISASHGYLNSSGSIGTSSATKSYSIKASHNIMAAEFNAVSDRRIKTNREPSSGKNDLDIVNQIQVTNYTHIDTVAKGNEVKKGFIAQQVESVFPQAVHQSTNFIPNVYSLSTQIDLDSEAGQITISLADSHQLQTGDRVRIIVADGTVEVEILEIHSPAQFTIKTVEGMGEQVFVYGKQVNDFRAVDYDRVFTAGIGAIQELSKQNDELKLETASLKDRLDKMEAMLSQLAQASSEELAKK